MRLSLTVLSVAVLMSGLAACVDTLELATRDRVDVIIVEGTLTNLAEPQFVQLNRSRVDRLTGRSATLPIEKATVAVVVDSSQVVTLHEASGGTYQLPSDFQARVSHRYQLRFTLADGSRYESTAEVMPAAVLISRVSHRFNPISLPAQRSDGQVNRIRAASDIYVDWQDPAKTANYYRWEWRLWEKQAWCRTCSQSFYLVWNEYNESQPKEACSEPASGLGVFVHDYPCRTRCWQVLKGFDLNLFDDAFSNGGQLSGRRVAQIPYYQDTGCLVEVRQGSLSRSAYQYMKQLQEQTQNTGGVADTPPAAPIGNVRNVQDEREAVVGYFTASAVATKRYWLDRKDATGRPPGLFQGLYGLEPSPEGILIDPNTGRGKPTSINIPGKNSIRPPTAVCGPDDGRTPFKPEGWRD